MSGLTNVSQFPVVKVRFPNGDRDYPARYEMPDDCSIRPSTQDNLRMSKLVPIPSPSWRFVESIGAEPNWHAIPDA